MIKLTKNELRVQQTRLQLLHKYLPTLQLKKALLQSEVSEAKGEIAVLVADFENRKAHALTFSAVLQEPLPFVWEHALKVKEVKKRYENVAGVEVPYLEEVVFEPLEYSLIETPAWVESALDVLQRLVSGFQQIKVAEEKKKALENELREVSIRVNLFEKILIPRALVAIKKIKVFLGDQQLASVSRAKVAKSKMIKCVSM